MKTKKFNDYLKKRLNKLEIAEIEEQAQIEIALLKSFQEDISKAVANYMAKEDIGFNELARRLDVSPSQVAKIQRGEANLTLASLAHLFALLKLKPNLIIHQKK